MSLIRASHSSACRVTGRITTRGAVGLKEAKAAVPPGWLPQLPEMARQGRKQRPLFGSPELIEKLHSLLSALAGDVQLT